MLANAVLLAACSSVATHASLSRVSTRPHARASLAAPASTAECVDNLLRVLESAVPRGRYTAPAEERQKIFEAIEDLERSAAAPKFPADLAQLDGSWDLLFTTNAIDADGGRLLSSLGSISPALSSPLLDGSPLLTRKVRQEVDVAANRVRNCVTITPWPEGAPIGGPIGSLLSGLTGGEVTLVLDHLAVIEAAVSATSLQAAPARLRIELQQVRRLLALAPADRPSADGRSPAAALEPLLELIPKETRVDVPWPLGAIGAGRFDTTFLDGSVRVSRGVAPGQEVRVFRRSATPAVVVSEGDADDL